MTGRIKIRRPLSSLFMLAGTVALVCAPAHASQTEGVPHQRFSVFKDSHPDLSRRQARDLFKVNRDLFRSQNLVTGLKERPESFRSNPIRETFSARDPLTQARLLSAPRLDNLRKTVQVNERGNTVGMRAGIDFNLDSSESNIVLGRELMSAVGSVSINIGGQTRQLVAGDQVTAAEYVAVKQVLSAGKQDINLDMTGRAIGGQLDLGEITSRNDKLRADDFYIPENVVAYGEFGRRASFQIDGDLTNAGSLVARSVVTRGNAQFDLRADSITNQSGALISADTSAAGDATVDFEIRTRDFIKNEGTISSTGKLTLTSYGKISNDGGTILAASDLVIDAPTIVNNSLIESLKGSVSLESQSPSDLKVDNRDGIIAARDGAINLRARNYRDSFNSSIDGGDLLSRVINTNSGNATADINVYKLTGRVNQRGLAAHVSADTDDLVLGSICLTGDPTFRNTGNISITGDLIVGEALTVIAGGDIENTVPLTIAAGTSTTGHPITLIAGANITSAGTNSPTLPGGTAVGTTISQGSVTGGRVILGRNGVVTIDSRGTGASGNQNGADVLIAAFSGTVSGFVDCDNSLIQTGGRGNGSNGNVTIISESVSVAAIDATGSTANTPTGRVTLLAAQPVAANVTWNANGTLASGNVTAGSFVNGAGVAFSGNVTAGDTIAAKGNVVVASDSRLETKNITNGIITLNGLAPSAIRDTIEFNAGSFISTPRLDLDSGDNITGIVTNAQIITAKAINGITVTGVNPDAVVLGVNTAGTFDGKFQGTVISDPSTKVTATVRISLESVTGNLGLSANSPLEFNSGVLELRALKGSVFADTNGATLLRGGVLNGALITYSLTTASDLTANANAEVKAQNIHLESTSGTFSLPGKYTASKSMSLISQGSITNATVAGTLTAPQLRVESTGGSIGVDAAANRFNPGAGVASIEAISKVNDVFLAGPNIKTFTITGGFAQNTFDYLGTGATNVTGDITALALTAGDKVSLVTANGKLSIASGVTLFSQRDLQIAVTAPTAVARKSAIVIGKDAEIVTQSNITGDILISIGDPQAPITGVKPKGVSTIQLAGSSIFFGTFGLKAKTPTNTLFALDGANITINNPVAAKNISLGGGVVMRAEQ